MINTDVIIIGAGASGVSASIYLKRSNINFLLIDKGPIGGKLNSIAKIANYPGFKDISGSDLAFSFYEQLKYLDVKLTYDVILSINQKDNEFIVAGEENEYCAKAIIIASGGTPHVPSIPGEAKLFGKGVSTCAICDGPFYKGRPVAVIGDTLEANQANEYLSTIASNVYHVNNEDIVSINGDTHVKSITTKNGDIAVDGVFVFSKSTGGALFGLNIRNRKGYIEVNNKFETSIEGIYACGDIADYALKQVVTAVSSGATSAISAINYLRKKNESH